MEWDYTSKPARWVLTRGQWRATVERLAPLRGDWSPRIERLGGAHERYDGPLSDDPMQARTWCLTKIAELRATTGTSHRGPDSH